MSQVCTSCGACCATFRVSFYWAETDAHPEGQVPARLTIPITPHHVAMRGTELGKGRCVALDGEIGHQVGCSIYPQRSSPCREFDAGEERCNQARQGFGLPPI
ncbi:MAG: hypothetical protein RL748_4572 [Pseudomonadota bacterium]